MMEWIKCSERLPAMNGEEILAFRQDDNWLVICLFMDIGFAYFSETEEQYIKAHAITHWCEITPPKP